VAKLPCMKLLAYAGCAAALLLAPSLARADDEPSPPAFLTRSPAALVDRVYLRSGGMVIGRVSDIATGDHVTILTPTGELRNLPWSDVDRVVVANTGRPAGLPPPRPPAPAPKPAPLEPDSAPVVGPFAFVHIEASGPAYLYRAPRGTNDYETACAAPCDMELPIDDEYRIGGNGTKTTPSFRLKASAGGRITLKVDGPNWFGIVGGGTLAVTGVTVAYAGLLLAAGSGNSGSSREDSSTVGLGCLVFGAAAAALGGFAFARSSTTEVVQTSPKAAGDAFVRAPSWRTASATEHGSSATFPLLFERRF